MDIEKQIKRIVKRLWPELTGDLHLPQWGRVVAVHQVDAPVKSTPSEPHYCVDVQVLNRQGKDDTAAPVLTKVPLPATGAGEQRGIFCYPKVGALVELSFILGQVNKPFIRSVFVEGATLPALQAGDALISKDASNYYRIDSSDNITEVCQAVAERVAKTKQRLVVKNNGKVWVGNETENLVRLVSDLMQEVITLADAVAAHKHPYTGTDPGGSGNTSPPDNAATSSGVSSNTGTLKSKTDSFKE